MDKALERFYMKTFATSPNFKEPGGEDVKTTLVFDRDYNGYFIRTASELAGMKILSKEEYYKVLAGDVTSVFPEYDPNEYYYDLPIYNNLSELLINDSLPIHLFKYVSEIDISKTFGTFIFEMTSRGTVLKRLNFSNDEYINLNSKFDIWEDFNEFRKNKQKYKKLGFRARKGALCYGPPGNGKTAQIARLSKFAEKEKFRVFFIDKGLGLENLFPFRNLFQQDDSVFVIEELTERVSVRSSEELLSFLDGELSWDNSYVIATTNFPEALPWNLVDRPSRFKVKVEFTNPTSEERMLYLKHMKVPQSSLSETVELTEGMSLDYIKNVVLDSFLEQKDIPTIIKDNKSLRDKIQNKFKATKMGL